MRFDYLFFVWRDTVGFLDCTFVVVVLFDIDLGLGVVCCRFDCDISTLDELRDL